MLQRSVVFQTHFRICSHKMSKVDWHHFVSLLGCSLYPFALLFGYDYSSPVIIVTKGLWMDASTYAFSALTFDSRINILFFDHHSTIIDTCYREDFGSHLAGSTTLAIALEVWVVVFVCCRRRAKATAVTNLFNS